MDHDVVALEAAFFRLSSELEILSYHDQIVVFDRLLDLWKEIKDEVMVNDKLLAQKLNTVLGRIKSRQKASKNQKDEDRAIKPKPRVSKDQYDAYLDRLNSQDWDCFTPKDLYFYWRDAFARAFNGEFYGFMAKDAHNLAKTAEEWGVPNVMAGIDYFMQHYRSITHSRSFPTVDLFRHFENDILPRVAKKENIHGLQAPETGPDLPSGSKTGWD